MFIVQNSYVREQKVKYDGLPYNKSRKTIFEKISSPSSIMK